jgi:uncharacterized protein
VPTPAGTARLHAWTPPGSARAPLLVLGHGAGGGIDAPDLQEVAAGVLRAGFRVVLVEQPWRVAGRRVAPAPATLDLAWVPAVRALRPGAPVVVGGRSAGARVACRTSAALGAAGVVCLAFPLHPPGRPDRSRAAELRMPRAPVLVIQGDRDPFGTAREVSRAAPDADVVRVRGGTHLLEPAGLAPALEHIVRLLRHLAE